MDRLQTLILPAGPRDGEPFRGKFLSKLRAARKAGKLRFVGKHQYLSNDRAFQQWLRLLRKTPWVVYAKKPFGGPTVVLKYLAKYTSRTAIPDRRLVAMEGGNVTFTYKDGKRERTRLMTLRATEFIRCFLLHVLPRGFVSIRRYGFLSNGSRKKALPTCRQLIAKMHGPSATPFAVPVSPEETDTATSEDAPIPRDHRCPHCGAVLQFAHGIPRLPRSQSP